MYNSTKNERYIYLKYVQLYSLKKWNNVSQEKQFVNLRFFVNKYIILLISGVSVTEK